MAPPPPPPPPVSAAAPALDPGRFRRQARGSPKSALSGLEEEVEKDIGLVSDKTGMPTWAVFGLLVVILGRGSSLGLKEFLQ